MTPGIQRFMDTLSDSDLIAKAQVAADDLAHTSNTERNSEWHEACFAATVLYCEEMNRRGLKLTTPPPKKPRPLDMKSELQRIKIAEACGWKRVHISGANSDAMLPPEGHGASLHYRNTLLRFEDRFEPPTGVLACREGESLSETLTRKGMPNWPQDLNDAVTLCDVLAGEGWSCWTDNAIPGVWQCTFRSVRNRQAEEIEHTAPTLAEAICGCFIRVKGLWTEDTATV